MRRPGLTACLLVLVVLTPHGTWAARPLDTEDTATIEPGKGELELSQDFNRSEAEDLWVTRGVLSVGVGPGLETRVEMPIHVLDPGGGPARAGFGDLLLGAKYRPLDETDVRPALLLAAALRLPSGDRGRGLGEEGVDVLALAAAGKAFGPLELTANVAYTFVTADRALDLVTLAASASHAVAPAWALVAEVVGRLGVDAAAHEAAARAGAVWTVAEGLRLDGAVAAGLTRTSPDVILTVGLTLDLF